MAAWHTEKAVLDIDTYSAELSPEGKLWLVNDHLKEELDLNPRATYDLLLFLHQHAAQIYQATHEPKESYGTDPFAGKIVLPHGNEGEAALPENGVLYSDPADPYLQHVYGLASEWAENAYNGPVRIVRIASVPFAEDQREPVPEILRGFRTWSEPVGIPDQAWRVTVWPEWGYKNFTANHVYVHRYGDQLLTGRSEWQSGTPYYLWLDEEAE